MPVCITKYAIITSMQLGKIWQFISVSYFEIYDHRKKTGALLLFVRNHGITALLWITGRSVREEHSTIVTAV